jgi:thymidylate synthase (FAD)
MNVMKLKCLDFGTIELMEGTREGDLLVVNAARCSFDKEHTELEGSDSKLLNYLAKHEHVLPFRHPSATLRIHAPIFVLRQLGKHQVGFSWSEVSRRYITTPPQFHYPSEWRGVADNVKQGSGGPVPEVEQNFTGHDYELLISDAYSTYQGMMDAGICPEQARMVLPQSMFTTTVTTGSLLGWFHMFKLRTEEHTQKETQEYATKIGEIMAELFPISWGALCEHCL